MTPEGAELIRASGKTHAALAREFGVSPALIWLIRNNRAYEALPQDVELSAGSATSPLGHTVDVTQSD